MTPTLIGVIVLFCAVVGIAVFFLCADVILGLRHRGEAAEGHADDTLGADEACALTLPAPPEHVPAPDPDMTDFEREMADVNVARITDLYLTNGSNQ